MVNQIIKEETKSWGNLEIMGERFVVLKKEYLEELLILLESVLEGEKLLKEKKTRTFADFLESSFPK
jgi:hypothetical protein